MSAQANPDAAYCANLVRSTDFERYAATLFVNPECRRGLIALFAFNVEISRIRDQISQPLAGEMRLQWWLDLLAGTAHGGARGNPVAAELLQAIDQYDLPRESLAGMIDAHRFDLYDEPMQTMRELEAYLQGTASALFDLGARVLGGGLQNGADLARLAGLAFGLTRILEALPAHASRGQIYVPLDEIVRSGAAVDDILAGKSSPELRHVLQDHAAQARGHFKLALGALARNAVPARAAFLPLALVDRKLRRMMSAGYEPFRPQPQPSNLATLWTLWRASRREPFRN